jgi:hypothetical protein
MLGKGGMGEWANTRQRLQKGVDEATGREIHALNKEMIAAGIGKFACGLGARKVAASADRRPSPEAFSHDTERVARFQREARMASSLNHPRKATERAIKDGIRLFVAAGKALSSVAGVCRECSIPYLRTLNLRLNDYGFLCDQREPLGGFRP